LTNPIEMIVLMTVYL